MDGSVLMGGLGVGCVSIRQHTSAYDSTRQHTSAYDRVWMERGLQGILSRGSRNFIKHIIYYYLIPFSLAVVA
jgi:hypothetical protein